MPDSISIDSLQLILTLSIVRQRLRQFSTGMFVRTSDLDALGQMVEEALDQHFEIMEKIHGTSEP